MHTFGTFYGGATGINLVYGVFINSLFNTGVSVFVLISGYFGINSSAKKYIRLEMETLFYSILSVAVIGTVNGAWALKDIIKALIPVASGKYWYITCYMLLMIFSPFINKIPEKLEKRDFQRLLTLMFIVFSAVPTVVQFHVMNDGGKGIANMLLMYLIGRYIWLYLDEKKSSKYLVWSIILVLVGFGLNMTLTMLRGRIGVYAPFARDCSAVIVLASVAIFMSFKQIKFQSSIVNKVAKHVVAVYLLEGAMRSFIGHFFDISVFEEKWYLFAVIAVYVVVVMMGCIVVDVIRTPISEVVDKIVYKTCYKGYKWISGKLKVRNGDQYSTKHPR